MELATDPERLRGVSVVLGVGLGVWAVSVLTTYAMARPARARRLPVAAGALLVVLACVAAALPVVQTMRYATVQADLVETLFTENRTATAPRGISEADPWAGRERVSILLLGGDGSVTREGVRTDSVVLLTIDTKTGRAVMFSLPRNMMYAQFPADSPLHDAFPEGFTPLGDDSSGMLNAVYGQVPARYPGILGDSDNEGADALKQAVAGSLGVDVDYYVLVNLLGFQQVVDAMGGVTVNVNEPVAINGDTDRGIPPTGYIQPGPNQHLDGFHALWFSRGRWGSDDYERMLRQRCMVGALIDEADPVTLVRRYLDLARGRQGDRPHRHPAVGAARPGQPRAQGQGAPGPLGRLRVLRPVLLGRPRLRLDAGVRTTGARCPGRLSAGWRSDPELDARCRRGARSG